MCKDIITNKNIILLTGKDELIYDMFFESIFKIFSNFNKNILLVETVVKNQEMDLINIIKKFFPKTQRISCFFHYKDELLANMRKYGLWTEKLKLENSIILDILSSLTIIHKDDLNIIGRILTNITNGKKFKYIQIILKNILKYIKYHFLTIIL